MSMKNSGIALKSVLMMGAAAGLMMASGGGARAQSSGYTYTPVTDPSAIPNSWQLATGINDAGQVVGYYFDVLVDGGREGYQAGFVDVHGSFTTIRYPGAINTVANGINNAGQIVGFASVGGGSTGFLDTNGTFTAVNDPLGGNTQPNAISNTGQIVGSYELLTGYLRGFSEVNGTYTTISVPGATATYAYVIAHPLAQMAMGRSLGRLATGYWLLATGGC